ncbi:hypothetical protein C8Q79DRAFT_457136 [Trametes meyenii]|nr:hypothetical protein C8Q79DRAFT_457136 [Trametes meyenii]
MLSTGPDPAPACARWRGSGTDGNGSDDAGRRPWTDGWERDDGRGGSRMPCCSSAIGRWTVFWEGIELTGTRRPPALWTTRENCERSTALQSSIWARERPSSSQDSQCSMRRRASTSSHACSALFSASRMAIRTASGSWGLDDGPRGGNWGRDWKVARRRSILSVQRATRERGLKGPGLLEALREGAGELGGGAGGGRQAVGLRDGFVHHPQMFHDRPYIAQVCRA